MAVLASILLIVIFLIAGWKSLAGEKRVERARIDRITCAYPDAQVRKKLLEKRVWQGMSEAQLIDSWGQPARVSQQVFKTKVKRTFRYGSNRYGSSVYLEGDRVTGWRQ